MTSDFWKQCEGAIVDGRYSLLRCLGNTAHAAAFVSITGEGGQQNVVKLVEAEDFQAEALLSNWAAVSKLSHPNLVRLFDSGRCEIAGTPFLYAVMEWAEDNLGAVLATRPLDEAEVREMLEPALLALDFLHSKGFVHAGIKPSNVMAGDRLQLASDSITPVGQLNRSRVPGAYDAPEWKEGHAAPANDVWALGLTALESFTRRVPDGDADIMAEKLPGAFADIVRHSLARDPQERWTVARIASRLQSGAPHGGAKPLPPPARGSGPATLQTDLAPTTAAAENLPAAGKQRSKWLYPSIGAALAALALFAFLGRRQGNSPAPETAQSRSIPAEPKPAKTEVAAATQAPLAPVQPPASPKPNPFHPRPDRITPRAVNSRLAGSSGLWYVVAATYTKRNDAEKRAREISRRWPQFKTEVSATTSGNGYYLVLLGTNLSQEGAARIQQRAVAAGLPRDTYIKNYPAN
ncbi:MAG: protein kinase [Acidobacteriota bacterium]|nr:protein kinase [Acidobacteriota bacterium]